MNKVVTVVLSVLAALLAACSHDAYDTGDGALSYMRADFVEAETDASSSIAAVLTDDGERLMLTRRVKADWASKPDTAYRALLYYNKVETDDAMFMAEPVAMSRVLTPVIKPAGAFTGGMKTDPVVFVSSWKSGGNRFINFDLKVKTASLDGEGKGHTIGMACENVEQKADGRHVINLRLYHDRADMPEYYSSQLYLSVPLSFLPLQPASGDEVVVRMATYDGEKECKFLF